MTKPFDPDALLQKARDVLGLLSATMTRGHAAADHRQAAGRARAGGGARRRARRAGRRSRTPTARLLHGDAPADGAARFPITHDGREPRLGRRVGRARPPWRALLEHLVAREVERKALGAEVLHLYREINLIYSFSEKLAALLDVERVAAAHAAARRAT